MRKLSKIAFAGAMAAIAGVSMWILPSRSDGSVGRRLTVTEMENIVGGCTGRVHYSNCSACYYFCISTACPTGASCVLGGQYNPNLSVTGRTMCNVGPLSSSCKTLYNSTVACGS